jgi:two-component system LytT family response regulator
MAPTLNVLETRLDPDRFFRISRSAIVSLDCVLEVLPDMGGYGEVRMRSGVRLPVSRRRLQELLARLGGRKIPGPAE